MRWQADHSRASLRRRAFVLAGMLALGGCASTPSAPWIQATQLAALPGSSVQVVTAVSGVDVKYERSQTAHRMSGAALGIIGAVAYNSHAQISQASAETRSRAYRALFGDYNLAPVLGPAVEKALRASPNYRDATYLPTTRNAFRGDPRDSDSAQTTIEADANVSDDESEAMVDALVRIASPDKKTLWHEYTYRSTTPLATLTDAASLKTALRGQDNARQQEIHRERWFADQGALLRKGLEMAAQDVALRIAYDLGAPWPEDAP